MNIDKNSVHVIIPYGIGDATIICGLKSAIEERYGYKIIPVVKPTHEVVMQMYDIKQYELCAFSEKELKKIGMDSDRPTVGKYFVAHPAFCSDLELDRNFLNHKIGFVEMFLRHFGIEENLIPHPPKFIPNEPKDLKLRLGVSKYEDIVLFAPELKSAAVHERIQDEWFLREAEYLKSQGCKVIVNTDFYRDIYANFQVELSLEELIFLGCRAGKVISQRSGFCDIIYEFVENMDIIYPNRAFYDLFNMSRIFEKRNPNVRERIISISKELRRRGYKKAAIYGYGNVGKRIYYSLKKVNYAVDFVIDQNPELVCDIRCFKLGDVLPETDVILIAVDDAENKIRNEIILRYGNISVISIIEIMKCPIKGELYEE